MHRGLSMRNVMTFNPGWDSNAQKLPTFTNMRDLQRQLKALGVTFQSEADESTTGPASFVAVDPDGIRSLWISTSETVEPAPDGVHRFFRLFFACNPQKLHHKRKPSKFRDIRAQLN